MNEKVAIVGIGGVLPGAHSLNEFWQNILDAKDVAIDVNVNRWRLDPDDLYSPCLAPDKVNSRRACLIQDFQFNSDGLAVDPALLRRLDPMYQILLHAGREAWNDAKTDPIKKERVGVIIGNIVLPTEFSSLFSDEILKPLFEEQLFLQPPDRPVKTECLNRYVAGLPGGLLAKALNLGAGAYTLDAACAASLYSLKYAADELLRGRCDAMLAGGVSRPDCLYTQMGFSQLNAISKSGRCSPFDHKADGLVVGEGAGIFVLKRLIDAIKHGDHIYASIEGIGLSNDIAGNIMSPDTEGQLRAMQAAYTQAGWLPNQVQYIECHGTGTPIGDSVEYNSLNALWQTHQLEGECVIGSVKGNVGHLLTAAGAAALIKTLLAMKNGILPPTAHFESPSNKIDLINSPFRVLSKAKVWEVKNGEPRRAAISGFGFGGINAHVLLQEYKQSRQQSRFTQLKRKSFPEVAIIGMSTRLGPWHNQSEFDEVILFGSNKVTSMPLHGWGADSGGMRGYVIDEVKIPLSRYRIPPAELREMLPQQLLMLEVAANAMTDAKLSRLSRAQQLGTGVFIGIGLDMNATNFHFRWMQEKYAQEWLQRLGINLSDMELDQWINRLRETCGPALSANRTMGALGGMIASRIARAFHIGGPSFTVSAEETSGLRALELGLRALQQGELERVIVGAVDLVGDPRSVKGFVPHKNTNIVADGATAFVLKRHEDALRAGDKVYALIRGIGAAVSQGNAIQKACFDAQCSLDSIDHICNAADDSVANIPALQYATSSTFPFGYTGAANGLMTVAHAVSFLHHRVLPKDEIDPEEDKSSIRHWLKDRIDGPRQALVCSDGIDGTHMSVVLQEANVSLFSKTGDSKLFILSAEDKQSLIEKINRLSFDDETRAYKQEEIYRIVLRVKDREEFHLAREEGITALNNGASIDNGRCFYSNKPMYRESKLAFVYPGSGNHFHGMGQELGVAFPNILEKLNDENDQLASQFAKGRFWQRDDGQEPSHEDVIFGQVWLGTFVSDIMVNFGVNPDAIIGYSLGETAGFFSTRTWKARDEMLRRIRKSTLFTEELAGPCKSVKKVWNTKKDIEWALGVVNAGAANVQIVLEKFRHVYLLIINTPNECVIGGDRAELNAVIKELKTQFHPLTGVTTVHCDAVKPVEKAYRDLHVFETTPPEGVLFYSGIRGGAYTVTQDTAADSILEQALTSFDYTRVINSAYEDGVRLFIEMGPGNSCTRMIAQILGNKPHYTKALCVKNQNSIDNFMKTLSRLFVEGVTVDFSHIQKQVKSSAEYKNFIRVKTGGEPFKVPHPPVTKPKVAELKKDQEGQKQVDFVAPGSNTGLLPVAINDGLQAIIEQMQRTEWAKAEAQEAFLRVGQEIEESLIKAIAMQMQLVNGTDIMPSAISLAISKEKTEKKSTCKYDRDMCLEFATGSISKILGTQFSDIDQHPTRVRLPDEPLMLVDRIIDIEGEPDSMTHGRIITEHDVLPDAWYLDQGRVPTCIAVEAGQADLFLSGYLGVDHVTHGRAVYRLLDARIIFHGSLPREGQTIRYDIHIDHFFRQGNTWLFRFDFESTVDGQPLLTMTQGCAGFFTQQELDAGKGIILTNMEKQPGEGKWMGGCKPLVSMQLESYCDEQMNALRTGDLVGCFGDIFSTLSVNNTVGFPDGRMVLVHRILKLDPVAGRYGMGQITGEADIHPDDWFLTCHFVDDRVMPGTLMYECCLHTLRVYLFRMGWIGEKDEFVCEPVIGEISQLKCRGQVIETTRKVQYEVTLKEIGYRVDGTPYALADALMYADHHAIVQIQNMSVQFTGLKREKLEALWRSKAVKSSKKNIFDNEHILAFAVGNPSEAFGDRYKIFDNERKIARLPGPPYQFLDRIISIKDCEQWVLKSGGVIEAEYDVPPDAWYFMEDNQPYMPFSILLEVVLQPCGWLAAYLGSALTSETDLSFRNLGGRATQYSGVTPIIGTLVTKVKITNVSQSGGMIIQNFDYEMTSQQGLVYKGNTYFGFFSKVALADQIGIREAALYVPTDVEKNRGIRFLYPKDAPMPRDKMRMVDEISLYVSDGGPDGLGYIEGKVSVQQDAWFFKAHFYQDPVWPGSLGLESFLQLLKVFAWERWKNELQSQQFFFESMALNRQHEWIYRGQILPTDDQVKIQTIIRGIDDKSKTIWADGFLSVDGRIIYQMKNFSIRIAL